VPSTRAVLDTNVWVSALLWTGAPHRLIRLAESDDLELVISPAGVEEVSDALARPKFAARIATLHTSVGELVESLLSIVEILPEPQGEAVIPEDPDDDRILACAWAADAHWIVSGDNHLLSLKTYRGIRIVSPRQVLNAWARRAQ